MGEQLFPYIPDGVFVIRNKDGTYTKFEGITYVDLNDISTNDPKYDGSISSLLTLPENITITFTTSSKLTQKQLKKFMFLSSKHLRAAGRKERRIIRKREKHRKKLLKARCLNR